MPKENEFRKMLDDFPKEMAEKQLIELIQLIAKLQDEYQAFLKMSTEQIFRMKMAETFLKNKGLLAEWQKFFKKMKREIDLKQN